MMQEGTRPNIVVVTVSCWRRDSLEGMPALREATRDWHRAGAICPSVSDEGALGVILASAYPSDVCEETARPVGSRSLPAVLADSGYETCAVAPQTTVVDGWRAHFAASRRGDGCEGAHRNPVRRLGGALKALSLGTPVPAETVLSQGASWYQGAQRPCFLWIHVTDAHEPYCPGLRKVRELGLVGCYGALVAHRFQSGARDRLRRRHRRRIRRLYEACIANVDAALADAVERFSGADIMVIVGDHGEEFDHGVLRHARLYDECTAVPFLARCKCGFSLPERLRSETVRQIDIAPGILSAAGVRAPVEWRGGAGSVDMSLMMSTSPELGEVYVGLRTPRWKYVRTHRLETMSLCGEELYDLSLDAGEIYNLAGDLEFGPTRRGLEKALRQELERCGARLLPGVGIVGARHVAAEHGDVRAAGA